MGPIHVRNMSLKTGNTSVELCSLLTRSTNKGNKREIYLLNESFSIRLNVLNANKSKVDRAASSSFFTDSNGRIQCVLGSLSTFLLEQVPAQSTYISNILSQTATTCASKSRSSDVENLSNIKSLRKFR